MGANAGLGIVDNNKGEMTFANQYDDRYLRGDEKLKGYTNEVLTKDGSIYTFGLNGKGRFQLTHSTPINDAKVGSQLPITLPNGNVITNYTITLTFRRAADLEPGMPTKPAMGNQTPVEKTTSPIQSSQTQVENIIKELGNKTQSKYVVLPGQDELEDVKYDGKNFWSEIVPEARSWFENASNPILIAFRGNKNKTFLQNYKEGNTIGNPFDWQKY
jgi:hypothetical protein